MVNGIRIIYPCGLNKGFDSKFGVGFRETPGEGRWTNRPKRFEYNNEDDDNHVNILIDYKLYLQLPEKKLKWWKDDEMLWFFSLLKCYMMKKISLNAGKKKSEIKWWNWQICIFEHRAAFN